MKPSEYIWMDGKNKKWKDATIHVFNHSFLYGSGVFEGIRFYKTDKGPAVFRLQDHIKRLFYSAKVIGIKFAYTQKQVCDETLKIIKKNKMEQGYVRPFGYYGYGVLGLKPKNAPSHLTLIPWAWGAYLGSDTVTAHFSKYIRSHPKSLDIKAKITGYYANSVLAGFETIKAGYGEAIFLDYKGNVAEAPGENFFMVKKGVLITPPADNILPGFTRDSVIKIAKDLGIKVVEKNFKPESIYTADECFFTGTAAEIIAISHVQDKKIGSGKLGPMTTQLKKEFTDVLYGKNKKYKKWLTYV